MIDDSKAKDALYYCHPNSANRDFAKGVIVGLVCGIIANTPKDLTMTIGCLKQLVLGWDGSYRGILDLQEEHVIECLPESWVEIWNSITEENF